MELGLEDTHESLVTAAIDSEGVYVLDFMSRVGARPFFRYGDDGWDVLVIAPGGENPETENTQITVQSVDTEYSTAEVVEQARAAPLLQLRFWKETPFENPESYEYDYGPKESDSR